MLDCGLPEEYTTELFEQKCGVLFQHVLEKYPVSGESVYLAAAGLKKRSGTLLPRSGAGCSSYDLLNRISN